MDMSDKQPGNADASIPENHALTGGSWLPADGGGKRPPRLKSKQKARKLIILSVAVVLVIAFAAWQLLPRLLNSGQEEQPQQRLSAVTRGDLIVSITGSGPLEPIGKQTVSAETDATITDILRQNGDSVNEGDLLMRLDTDAAAQALEEAENNLADALSGADTTSDELAALVVRAPFDGRVTDVQAQVDEEVGNNTSLLTLTDTTRMKTTVSFGISDRGSLQAGQTVHLTVPEIEGTVMGTIALVSKDSHAISGGGQAVDVEISLANPGALSSGMSVTAKVETGTRQMEGLEAGTLEYAETKTLRAAASGTVSSLKVRSNQLVKKGAVLLVMENEDLLSTADSNNRKMETLTEKVEDAQALLASCEVRAPANGIVTNLNGSRGDAVKNGSALCSILDVSRMTLEIAIDELDIGTVEVGQEVSVTVDAVAGTSTTPLQGNVTGIAVEGTYSSGVTTFPVTLTLEPDERLRSGMNADAAILVTNKADVLLVPIEAVTTVGERSYVYVSSGSVTETDASTSPNMPEGFTPGDDPEGFTPGDLPEGFTPGDVPEGFTRPEGATNGTGTRSARGNRTTPEGTTSENGTRQGTTRNGATSDVTGYYAGTTRVWVEVGAHNEISIEILSGLAEGDEVVLPALTTSSATSSSGSTQTGGLGGLMGGMGGAPAGAMPAGGPTTGGGGFRPD